MEIAAVFNDAAAAGVDAITTLNQIDVLTALKKIRQTFPELRVCPIIPNVIGYVREATDCGIVGAARRRIQQMALLSFGTTRHRPKTSGTRKKVSRHNYGESLAIVCAAK
jgi:hypothetical protein